MNNFSEIEIGSLIQIKVKELQINIERICKFLKCTENEIELIYCSKSIDSNLLLKWSKLLKYDFFRIYSQHLILYSPPIKSQSKDTKTSVPLFRKNIYTMELINFILEVIESGKKTKKQIIDEYRIPKTTLYKWIKKYK